MKINLIKTMHMNMNLMLLALVSILINNPIFAQNTLDATQLAALKKIKQECDPDNFLNRVDFAEVTKSGKEFTQTVTFTQDETTLTVSTSTIIMNYQAGSTVEFSVTSNVDWTVGGQEEWLTVNPVSGSGNGIVTLTAEADTSGLPRTVTLKISGNDTSADVVVVQYPPLISVSSDTLIFGLCEEKSTIAFNIISNIEWVTSSSQSWLTIDPMSGKKNASVTLTATANTEVTDRNANVIITGQGEFSHISQLVTVTQRAPFISVSPVIQMNAEGNHPGKIEVQSNITWSISNIPDWLTIANVSGAGNAIINVTAATNPDFVERTAYLTISGENVQEQTILVTQSGQIPSLSVIPSVINIGAEEGSTAIMDINSNVNWSIGKILPEWLHVSDTSGQGSTSVILTAEANLSDTIRISEITLTGQDLIQIVTVKQGTATLSVSKSRLTVKSKANSLARFKLFSNTEWVISSDQYWLRSAVTKGEGDASIILIAKANSSIFPRTAIITVSAGNISLTIPVTQISKEIITNTAESDMDDVLIYPNPVDHLLNIELSSTFLPAQLGLYSLEGKEINHMELSSTSAEIDMETFIPGIYVIVIRSQNQSIVKKIIKIIR